jgi:cob(I)alamin adenosyltransferase
MTLKIYTRTGDDGETGLFGGQRVPKDHLRVDAYGDVDELNSVIGVAIAALAGEREEDLSRELRRIQGDLFVLGARLATPPLEEGGRENPWIPQLDSGRIAELESAIDAAETEIEPLKHFVLPGGSDAAAALHLARTVCRRAERRVVALARASAVDDEVLIYLNRLSDLLFTQARLANHRAGVPDVPWIPNPR